MPTRVSVVLLCWLCAWSGVQLLDYESWADQAVLSGGLCRYGNGVECCWGWRQMGRGRCEPHCQQGCKHGECVGPDRCKCQPGYMGKACNQDVNECGLKPRPCKHRCMNTAGSYKCYCLDGYALQPDGSCRNARTCYHANCQYGCEVIKGAVRCTCPSPGLQLGPDRRTCVDIDECVLGGGVCPRRRKCVNTFGSFLCKCHLGFKLVYINGRYTCIDKDTRPFCSLNPSSPKCRCLDGSCRAPPKVTLEPQRPRTTPATTTTTTTPVTTTTTTTPVTTTTEVTTTPPAPPVTTPTTAVTTTTPTTTPVPTATLTTSPIVTTTTTTTTTTPFVSATSTTAIPSIEPATTTFTTMAGSTTTAPTTTSSTTTSTSPPTTPELHITTPEPTTTTTTTTTTTIPTTTTTTTTTTIPTTTSTTTTIPTTTTTTTTTIPTTTSTTTVAPTTIMLTTVSLVTTTVDNKITKDAPHRPRGDVHIPRHPNHNQVWEFDIELGNSADYAEDEPEVGVVHCTFDHGACDWISDREGDVHWETSPNPAGGWYLSVPELKVGQKSIRGARLAVHIVPPWRHGDVCFSFSHWLTGHHVGVLQLFARTKGRRQRYSTALWSRTGGHGWRRTQVTLTTQSVDMVLLKAERRRGRRGKIAVDDVTLRQGACR